MTEKTIHPGYWEKADGTLTPVSKIKEIDKDRHRTVTELCEQAKVESARLAGFKLSAANHFDGFLDRSAALYGAKLRGVKGKGNVTITSYEGRYKIERQIADRLVFDERIQTAKVLIDECIQSWSKGSKAEIKAIVNNAFRVDKAGRISTERVLELRRIESDDPKFAEAMRAIADSMQVASSKAYLRFYERNEHTNEYVPINLNVAAI